MNPKRIIINGTFGYEAMPFQFWFFKGHSQKLKKELYVKYNFDCFARYMYNIWQVVPQYEKKTEIYILMTYFNYVVAEHGMANLESKS